MSDKGLSRRIFAAKALSGVAAVAFAQTALAHHRRSVDLVVTALRWSEDFGVTWHTDPVLEGSDVWFEATVKNIGLAAAAVNRTLRVDFRVNGTTVSSSTSYRSGLSPGQTVNLRANTGPDADEFWNSPAPGTYSVSARVDPANVFKGEHSGTTTSVNGEANNILTVSLIVEASGGGEPGPLTPSGPVTVTANGQVIQGLDITATGTAHAVRVGSFSDVVVRGCRVRHANGKGVYGTNAPRLLVEDVDILCTAAPAAGANPSSEMNNIELQNCDDAIVRRARLEKGSTGVYVVTSDRVRISFVAGKDFRGPFPRGQVVQFNQCLDPLLEDFSCVNEGHVAWTEDNVNCYGCTDPIVRRGFIRGNNSPSGQGVIVENTAGGSGGLIEDVDVVFWGNGAFMANGASSGVQFWRCRARDGIDDPPNNSVGKTAYDGTIIPDWDGFVGALNRGTPSSGGEPFFAYQTATPDIEFHACQYFNIPRSVAYDRNLMTVEEFTSVNFVPRAPIVLAMPWE